MVPVMKTPKIWTQVCQETDPVSGKRCVRYGGAHTRHWPRGNGGATWFKPVGDLPGTQLPKDAHE